MTVDTLLNEERMPHPADLTSPGPIREVSVTPKPDKWPGG
jgi:hypothetical protein